MDEWAGSLRRRIAAMHQLWQIGVKDLTLDQVNHVERSGVLPIAFTLLHSVCEEDDTTSRYLLDERSRWDAERWSERVRPSAAEVGWRAPLEAAEEARIGDIDAWRDYQTAVFARTEATLRQLPGERFTEEPFGPALPSSMDGAFISYVIEPGRPPILLDLIECFIYQHGIRHLGELEHARALVGLGGTT